MIIISYEFNKSDVYDLARHINAETKQNGSELTFKYCPYCNGGSHSDKYTFSVSLNTGQFNCLRGSCDKKGGFITLARDMDFKLNFGSFSPLKKDYRSLPHMPIKSITVTDKAIEYLKHRGISESVAKRYGITTDRKNDSVICFPFYDLNGDLIMIKYRNTKFKKGVTNGCKEWTSKDTKPLLFGIQCVNMDKSGLVVTEGQIDSLSLAEAGIENAVSVPNGKNAFEWINTCWDFINHFGEITVFGDYENGEITLADEINRRFKHKTVKAVRKSDYRGAKDANEILTKYGAEALRTAVSNADKIPVKHIIDITEVKPYKIEDKPHFCTGIKEIDETLGGFFTGQYITLTGKRGEGKSTLMSQIVCEAVEQGVNTLVYSGELPNDQFKNWLDQQLAGSVFTQPEIDSRTGRINYTVPDKTVENINKWLKGKLYIKDDNSLKDGEDLFDILESAIYRYSIKFLCIDNLMTINDYNKSDLYHSQAETVGKLKDLAISADCCILLVAHERKTATSNTNDNVSGSADITNRADAVLAYRRNTDENADCDGFIEITKNRLYGDTRLKERDTAIKTYYDKTSRRIRTEGSRGIFQKYYSWVASTGESVETLIEQSDMDLPF